jgi:hypothetical protein
MQKFRVYFATKFQVKTSWFRRKKDVIETEYVVVTAHNEAHAVKLAKEHVPQDALGMPFEVTQIRHADPDDTEGYHGSKFRPEPIPGETDQI